MRASIVLALFALVLCAAGQIQCSGGSANTNPLDTGLTFVNQTANGKLYRAGSVEPPLYVVHLWGSPYDMGLAQGTLLREQIAAVVPQFYAWIDAQVTAIEPGWMPQSLKDLIARVGVKAALDLEWAATELFTRQAFFEEAMGIADGAGVEYADIYRIQMLPELTQAACSMVGAWGSAISGNSTLTVRALDWSTNTPFQQFPVVSVYHPSGAENSGHPFAQLTWAGFYGTITGYSSEPLTVCEKVWDGYNGTFNRFGVPWNFLLRDVLQFDATKEAAIARIQNATRTCAIFVGLGDSNGFDALEYSFSSVNVWTGASQPTWQGHPTLTDMVYIDKHVQPSHDPCLGSLLQAEHGSITAAYLWQQVVALAQTGDMHAAIADFGAGMWYVANASPWLNNTCVPAYQRPFTAIDMVAAFAEQPPTM